MRPQEQLPGLAVRCYALKQRKNIACLIRHSLVKERWRQKRVHMNDLLKQGRNRADRVPNEGSELSKVLPLLTERIQSVITLVRVLESVNLLNDTFLDFFTDTVIG